GEGGTRVLCGVDLWPGGLGTCPGLIHLEAFLSWLCCACEGAYRVLHWETPALSSQFYGALLGSLCVLYLLPLCWVLALLNSTLFLGNAEFYRGEPPRRHPRALGAAMGLTGCQGTSASWSPPRGGGLLLSVPSLLTPTSSCPVDPGWLGQGGAQCPAGSPGSSPRLSWALRQEDDDVSQCSVEFDIGLPDSSVMSKNEVIRSKVSRLTERLRKRYPSNNFGSCTGCAATFSVLKKRRSCSNCGNSFCSRCCSYKVPKSSMGATAPDAQRETVFVCASCNQALVK
uniref:Protrudin n=1 Tax=Terrapene triunguis TaxID=2587831 RepID=A0A674HW01_9SAUR